MVIKRKIKKLIKILRTRNLKFLINRFSGKQYSFTLTPTLLCNLKCQMCHQCDIRKEHEQELTTEEIKQILANMKKKGINQVTLIGGEIFLDKKKIWEIIDFMEKERILFALSTNATLLTNEDIERIGKLKFLIEMDISVDGDEKIHDKIRGVNGSYSKTINNIKKLKTVGVPLMIVTVLQKDNLNMLESIAKSVKETGADTHTFVTEFSVTKKELDDSKSIIEKLSSNKASFFMSHSVNDTCFDYDLKKFNERIASLKEFCNANSINCLFSFEQETFNQIYDKSARNKSILLCPNIEENSIQIDWTGKRDFCPFIRIHKMEESNALEKEFKIDSNELEELRENVKKCNLLPVCTRCCGVKIKRRQP